MMKNGIKYIEKIPKYSDLELEYLEKKRKIENRYNNPVSYLNWNENYFHLHPIHKMLDALDDLDEIYLPLIEKEKKELFD